jgi:hypothetical protein
VSLRASTDATSISPSSAASSAASDASAGLRAPSAPAGRARHRSGADRFAGQKRPRSSLSSGRRRVAARRLLGEALEAQRLEIARDVAVQQARGRRIDLPDLSDGVDGAVGPERRAAGEQLVQDRAQPVDVAARVGLASGGLFGRHVAGRSHRAAARGQGSVDRHPVGETEVGDARAIRLVDQDVPGLEVAVHDAQRVRRVHGGRDVAHVAGRALGWQRRAAHQIRQALALDQLHREVRLAVVVADLEHRDGVRVTELGGGARFLAKAVDLVLVGELAGGDELQRDLAIQRRIARPPHHAHRAAPDRRDQIVTAEAARGGRRWGGRRREAEREQAARTGVVRRAGGQGGAALAADGGGAHSKAARRSRISSSTSSALETVRRTSSRSSSPKSLRSRCAATLTASSDLSSSRATSA